MKQSSFPASLEDGLFGVFHMLTQQQIDLVKGTVPVLAEHGVALTTHFYARMMKGNPELRQVFNQGHQRAGRQQASLAGAVLAYAQNIENPAVLIDAVKHIANKHASIGIRAEHYGIVGRHLLASIQEVLGDAATPELIDAWAAAYGQLADLMIGLESDIYRQSALADGGWSVWRGFRIAEKKRDTATVTSFVLVPVDGGPVMAVKPGQYISVRLHVKSENLVQPRQYTVTDAGERHLRISVKRIAAAGDRPAGMVSNALHDEFAEGDLIDVMPPLGEFVLQPERPAVFVSAGIGITPMVAMLRAAAAENRPVTFFHVCRDDNDFALGAEVREMMAGLADGRLVLRRTAVEGRPGDDDYAALVRPDAVYYLCGPADFMKAAAAGLLKAGVADADLRAELFGTGFLSL